MFRLIQWDVNQKLCAYLNYLKRKSRSGLFSWVTLFCRVPSLRIGCWSGLKEGGEGDVTVQPAFAALHPPSR
jgi:hypothetical protein